MGMRKKMVSVPSKTIIFGPMERDVLLIYESDYNIYKRFITYDLDTS